MCFLEDHKISYIVYEKFLQPFIHLFIYFALKIHCGLLEANDPQYPQGDCFQNLKALQSNASYWIEGQWEHPKFIQLKE